MYWRGINSHRRERYLAALTHISSRAFPSRLLTTLHVTHQYALMTSEGEASHTILIPGMDLFNRWPILVEPIIAENRQPRAASHMAHWAIPLYGIARL